MLLGLWEVDCPTDLNVDVDGVEVGAVDDPSPGPGQEQQEVSMVEVAHTVACEHAVVFSLEDADATGGAVPCSGGSHRLTHCTVMPVLSPYLGAGDDNVSGAGVHQPTSSHNEAKQ